MVSLGILVEFALRVFGMEKTSVTVIKIPATELLNKFGLKGKLVGLSVPTKLSGIAKTSHADDKQVLKEWSDVVYVKVTLQNE